MPRHHDPQVRRAACSYRTCSPAMNPPSQVGRAVPSAPGVAGEGPPALPAGGSWEVVRSGVQRDTQSGHGLVVSVGDGH